MMQKLSACPSAAACLTGGPEAPCLRGKVCFFQMENCVLVTVNVSGLPCGSKTGFYGLHIHEGGECTGEGFSSTGGHYNPCETLHPIHAGDLPPLMRCNGGAYLSVKTDRFRVRDIIGRTVVIHSDADDFTSQPSGNSGMKIACGVICRV